MGRENPETSGMQRFREELQLLGCGNQEAEITEFRNSEPNCDGKTAEGSAAVGEVTSAAQAPLPAPRKRKQHGPSRPPACGLSARPHRTGRAGRQLETAWEGDATEDQAEDRQAGNEITLDPCESRCRAEGGGRAGKGPPGQGKGSPISREFTWDHQGALLLGEGQRRCISSLGETGPAREAGSLQSLAQREGKEEVRRGGG